MALQQEFIPFTPLSSSSTPRRSNPSSVLDLFPVPARTEGDDDDDGHWIKKRLSLSDVNHSSRLLVFREDVMERVLPLMNEEMREACQSKEGLRVKIWDLDTLSQHQLTLKQWKPRSFLLTSNWKMEFVNRRNLQEGQCIGLRWDTQNLRFLFQKFNDQS